MKGHPGEPSERRGGEEHQGAGDNGDDGMQGSEVTEPTTEPLMVEHSTFAVPVMYRAEP